MTEMHNWSAETNHAIKAGVKAQALAKFNFTIRLVRRVLFDAQKGRCGLCGQALERKFGSPKLTFDHVWPKVNILAPCSFEGNTLLAHEKCNTEKGCRRPTGCEIVTLFVVNRRLGYREHETHLWDRA